MRKTKALKLNDRELTVRELTVREVWQIMQPATEGSSPDLLAGMDRLLKFGCPELDREALLDLAPSELRQVWEVFAEVNADFLDLAAKAGLGGVLENIKAELAGSLRNSSGLSAPSSPAATE